MKKGTMVGGGVLVAAALVVNLTHGYSETPARGSISAGTAQPIWPEQIHMALTGKEGEVVVEWVSGAPHGSSMVQISDEPGCCDTVHCGCFPYWCWRRNQTGLPKGTPPTVGPLIQNVTNFTATDWFQSAMPRDPLTGNPTPDVDTIPKQRVWMDTERNPASLNYTMHQALVTGLQPGKHYFYRVGSDADRISVDSNGGSVGSWSDIVAFTAFPPAHREPIWAVYGDMGATTDQYRHVAPSIPVLTKEQEAGEFDGIIHAGDYAYDFAPYGGRVGDQFMNLIQPFASRVPYMAGVGNHESGGVNRKHFAMRFAGMQFVGENSGAANGGVTEHGDQLWWSFDAGLVHWIAVDTELWNCAHMAPHGDNESYWSSVWNPQTNRSYLDEFMPWLEADLDKANANRDAVPWVVGFAHKGWYMQPEVNFSMIDDVLHKGGADLFFAGHIHVYQRFLPLRTSPYGSNASHPNNVPADVDFQCASTVAGPDYSHSAGLVANNTYTNPLYMTTIIAGGPGDPEITPLTNSGECTGNMTGISISQPMAVCRDNYGYGKFQAVNKTHLHWTWSMTGVGTPKPGVWEAQCKANASSLACLQGPLPPPSSIPPAAKVDELWIIKDKRRPGGNPVQGPRDYDVGERGSGSNIHFKDYVPTKGSTFQKLYDANREEWKPEGCGELAPDPFGAECVP